MAKAELHAGNIIARIRTQKFSRSLQAQGVPLDYMPVVDPLVGELVVTYAFDVGDQFVMATRPLLKQAGLELMSARQAAVANLARRLLGHGFRVVPDQGCCLLRVGDTDVDTHLEAACLLYPEALNLLEDKLQPQADMLLCAPTHDSIFALDSARTQTHSWTLKAARRMWESDPAHGLSLQWMRRSATGGFEVVAFPPAS